MADPSEPIAAFPEPGPRFCTGCGAALVLGACEPCSAKTSLPSPPPTVDPAGRGGVSRALWLYFLMLAASMSGLVWIKVSGRLDARELLHVEWWTTAAFIAFTLAFSLATPGRTLAALAPPRRARWWGVAALGSVATFGLAELVLWSAGRALGSETLSLSDPYVSTGLGWGWAWVAIAVTPAVMEEIAFRGVILSGLRSVLSTREAIIVSALMFGILHLSILSLPHLVLLGGAAAALRVRSGSLLPCMLLHLLHNTWCLVGEAFGGGAR